MVNIIVGLVCGVLVFSSVFLIGFLVWVIQQERCGAYSRVRSSHRAAPLKQRVGKRVNPLLHRRLVCNLLNGDNRAALRLVSHNRKRFPGRPEDWYWEKAIYDLERDRY